MKKKLGAIAVGAVNKILKPMGEPTIWQAN